MNELKHMAEFRSVLDGYKLSDESLHTLLTTKLALLVGPTACGRNTILNELVESGDYFHIVSDTTRTIRTKDGQPIEVNGREYWFRNEDDVLADLKQGEYMEAAIIHNQQVSGCNMRELEAAKAEDKIAIKDMEPNGTHFVHGMKPDAVIIFVLPPNFDEWMHRLRTRSELPEDEIRRRLESSDAEIEVALHRDYFKFVINDKLKDAIAEVDAIAREGRIDADRQQAGRELAQQLHRDIKAYLK
jgi:guanylate kinase